MNIIFEYAKKIEQFQKGLKGVFTLEDLKAMFACRHLNTFYRTVAKLEDAGIIHRFSKGVYVTHGFDLNAVSQKIYPRSYISLENVLAKHLVLGTAPKHTVRAIKVGKGYEYASDYGRVFYFGIAPHLYFGFETVEGINFADCEKALLDTLYFYIRGAKFYFDIYSDMNLQFVNQKRINAYLKKYKNPKFVNFVKNFLKNNQRP